MNVTRLPYTQSAQPALLGLVAATSASTLHVIDMPYRLSSWALDDPANVSLWVDAQGALIAWAALQLPFWMLDIVCQPLAEDQLLPLIMDWADARCRELQQAGAGRPMWFCSILPEQVQRRRVLEQAGYSEQTSHPTLPWSDVLLRNPLTTLPDIQPPSGVRIRPLAGQAEVPAYVALHQTVFNSKNMTVAWRARTLEQPLYNPALDLVAVDAANQMIGFCIGWLNSAQPCSAQVEPFGVHPDYHGQGIGKALMSVLLQACVAVGAQQVFVETEQERVQAVQFYQRCGFEPLHPVLIFRKDYPA